MFKHPPTTPLRTMLGLTALFASAPDLLGPSAMVDRRTHLPADMNGHAPMSTAKMTDPMHGATMAADGLGGAGGFKGETLIDGDMGATGHVNAETGAALDQDLEAVSGAVANIKQS